jgi:hypothetical protein
MTPAEIKELAEQLAAAVMFELICGDGMPAWYRRDLLRQELASRSNAAAEDFLERVMGRLDDDDPMVELMGGA